MIHIAIEKRIGPHKNPFHLKLRMKIEKHQFVALYGPSGSGKTSALRTLAGLTPPDAGLIEVNGTKWYDSKAKINMAPKHRHIGFVFQDYALFPNMTVAQNLHFASYDKDRQHIEEILDLLEIEAFKHHKSDSLSGGQQQRVALGRALAQKPQVLLLDEPFSALDHTIRIKIHNYLQKIHEKFQITTLLVSHNIAEIQKLAELVFVIDNGEITQQGAPSKVFFNDNVSGKFKFTGEVIAIERQDIVFIISVLIEKNIVKVVAEQEEADGLQIGDKVMVASKAFNPYISKLY